MAIRSSQGSSKRKLSYGRRKTDVTLTLYHFVVRLVVIALLALFALKGLSLESADLVKVLLKLV